MTRWFSDAEALFQMLEQWPFPVEFCEHLRSIEMDCSASQKFLVSWNRGRDTSLDRGIDIRLQPAVIYDYGKLLVSLCYASEADTPRAHLVFQQWTQVVSTFEHEIVDCARLSDAAISELRFGANTEAVIRMLAERGASEVVMRRKVVAIVAPVRDYFVGHTGPHGDMEAELALFEAARLLDPNYINAAGIDINILKRFRFSGGLDFDALRRELPEYQRAAKEQSVLSTSDWTDFWKRNGERFPTWSKLAAIIALMPSSSGAAERVFGMLRRLFEEQVTNLSDSHLEAHLKMLYNSRKEDPKPQNYALAFSEAHLKFQQSL